MANIKGGHRGGRPTKCTADLIRRISQAILAGLKIEVACQYVNISKNAFYMWLDKGSRAKEGSIYRKFYDAIKGVEAQAELNLLLRIQNDESWQSSAWILERRFRDRWAKKEIVEVSGPDGGAIEMEERKKLERLSPKELDEYISMLEKMNSGKPDADKQTEGSDSKKVSR